MKKLMSSRPSGLAIIEVILVMSISALLFGVVIGTFATRRKAAADTAAHLVMSEIARVRNQAQQGQGATTTAGATALAGNEMFGQAINLVQNSSDITVHKLMQSRTNSSISSYESYIIKMPGGLQWYIEDSTLNSYCSLYFSSCYGSPTLGRLSTAPISLYAATNTNGITLVFRNNTGQSYAFATPIDTTTIGTAGDIANYLASRQSTLRLAFGIPGAGATDQLKFTAGRNQFYVNFNLSIPNNQDLTVVK